MLRTALCLVAALACVGSARAEGAFDKWLTPDSPECVPVSEISAPGGIAITDLTPAQFQFARALYVAIPPVSKTFPPGDSAIKAVSGDAVMLAIVAGDKVCARFLAPDFVQKMLSDIEKAPL